MAKKKGAPRIILGAPLIFIYTILVVQVSTFQTSVTQS